MIRRALAWWLSYWSDDWVLATIFAVLLSIAAVMVPVLIYGLAIGLPAEMREHRECAAACEPYAEGACCRYDCYCNDKLVRPSAEASPGN